MALNASEKERKTNNFTMGPLVSPFSLSLRLNVWLLAFLGFAWDRTGHWTLTWHESLMSRQMRSVALTKRFCVLLHQHLICNKNIMTKYFSRARRQRRTFSSAFFCLLLCVLSMKFASFLPSLSIFTPGHRHAHHAITFAWKWLTNANEIVIWIFRQIKVNTKLNVAQKHNQYAPRCDANGG